MPFAAISSNYSLILLISSLLIILFFCLSSSLTPHPAQSSQLEFLLSFAFLIFSIYFSFWHSKITLITHTSKFSIDTSFIAIFNCYFNLLVFFRLEIEIVLDDSYLTNYLYAFLNDSSIGINSSWFKIYCLIILYL